ncbi:MAG: cation diffusion facilitator CzcD-associated flavoprotein CzcO [Gammaproteobacteria bacterium]|jgi:cation diffusion facilitator CzcD-associated flavoprotein CzcO
MKKDSQYFETMIIGTGFSGLLAAIRLKKKNLNDFVLLERGSDLGGTWRDNSYPGAEVDIPTGLYSISFIPYKFKKKYSPQSELLEYTNYVIDKFGIRKHAKTNQAVTKLTYNESNCLWHVEVESGERYTARFIIDTSGVLANPKIPYIEGAELFRGAKFHTGQWDHNVSYKGKRVGVIGSGCSAAQVVPAIAGQVDRLTVFMGKAQWIIPRSDRSYSSVERFITNLPGIRHIKRLMIFSYHEVRFVAFRRYPFTLTISRLIKNLYARNLKKNLEKYIDDDKLRQHMMPDYELGCRRVIPTNTYLPALSRNNVDVDISGIQNITPTGIRTREGKNIPLDIIVYATGFLAYSNMKKALSFQVYGSGGRNLNSEWEIEAVSYKGITVSGYPNYFKVNGPNTGTGHSSQLCYMETMVNYTVKAICAIKRDKSIKAIDVRSNVQREYVAKTKKNLKLTVWQSGGTTAFYRKNMTGEVTSLSPESVVNFIFSRKWFRLADYHLLR